MRWTADRSRRQLLAATSGTLATAGLAGCLGARSDDTTGAADSETDHADCDRKSAPITDPDGDAAVSVSANESIGDATPDSGVILAVTRIEFDGADVPTVSYETDVTVELWADDGSSDGHALLEEKPIPVGTYSGIRVYGTASVAEPSENGDSTVSLADGAYIGDVFGVVFEPGDRTEFTFQTTLAGRADERELDFNGRMTTGW